MGFNYVSVALKCLFAVLLIIAVIVCVGKTLNKEIEKTLPSTEETAIKTSEESLSNIIISLVGEFLQPYGESWYAERKEVQVLLAGDTGPYSGVWATNNEYYYFFEAWEDGRINTGQQNNFTLFYESRDVIEKIISEDEEVPYVEINGWVEADVFDEDAFLNLRKRSYFDSCCPDILGYMAELYEDLNGTLEGNLTGQVYVLTNPFDDPYLMEAEVWYCLKNREPVKATLKFDREGPFKLLSVTIDEEAVYSQSEVEKAFIVLQTELTIRRR